MDTKSKIKKLLIIYSAIVVAIGIFSASALFYKERNVKAAGWMVVKANGFEGDGCFMDGTCHCSHDAGCEIYWFDCPNGFTGDICLENEHYYGHINSGESRTYTDVLGSYDCSYVQIDLNSPGAAHTAGDLGAMTLEWDDFSVCEEPPPPPPPPPEDVCPYDSTEAKVKIDTGADWQDNLQVTCGDNFIVGSFHKGQSSFANDTIIKVYPPGGAQAVKVNNNDSYQTSTEGKYDVKVFTKIPDSDALYEEEECLATAQVTCVPEEEEKGCPYKSTQARVKKSISSNWKQSLNLTCGESFIVGSFHDGQNPFATDTIIKIHPPLAGASVVNNNDSYQTNKEGNYKVKVLTKVPDSNKTYSEDECLADALVTCSKVKEEKESGYTITKVATNDDGPYDIGDVVNFRVEIVNTGEKTLKVIAYRDVFDNRYLQFRYVAAVSPAHPGGINMTPYLKRTVSGNITTLSSDDITVQLGDLEPGKLIYFDYTFTAKSASNRACNDVFAKPEGLSEKQARDCVGIIISTDY